MRSTAAIRLLGSFPRAYGRRLPRPGSCAAATTFTTATGTADPEPQGDDAEAAAKAAAAEQQRRERLVREGDERETASPTTGTKAPRKSSPFAASPKLESSEVPPRVGPAFQQKRELRGAEPTLEGVSCVGWDGMPLRRGAAADDGQWLEQQPEQTEDYKEYFEHHKPTPLSELEFADTRRPIRRATDSDVVDDDAGLGDVPRGWREEQEDTVDAALLRAEAMFGEAARRGDPDAPHGRVVASYHRLVLQ